jgi:MFS family permease
MSEAYGCKIAILLPIFGLMVFSFATAAAKDLQTILITRFFAGVFGCSPLTIGGAVLADFWPPTQRGGALIAWAVSVLAGPLFAPLVGGALVVHMPVNGWRWTELVRFLKCFFLFEQTGIDGKHRQLGSLPPPSSS